MNELIAFFTSYKEYLKYNNISKQYYDDLLKGTNANIYIPLWASCKNGEKILNNEITLDVIKFYKKYGYTYQRIDGNPADYIGEQLLFIDYLAKAHEYDAIEEFKNLYYIDTVMNLLKYLPEKMKDIRNLLLDSIEYIPQYKIITPLNKEIEVDELKTVCSAGINNCGGKCRSDIGVREGCIIHIDTDRSLNDPQIRACVRGRGYKRTFMNSERLKYPMKRIGKRGEGRFKRITYDEATTIIADKMEEVMNKYGPLSRYVIYSTGVSAVMRPDDMIKRLLNITGGYLATYNSYSSAAASYVTPYIYGDSLSGNSEEDVLNTKFLILWGHNPSETIFGSHRNYYISKLKEKGVKIVVIDPRCSDSVLAYASKWIPIKPGTDSALCDAMAYVIYKNNLQDQEFMNEFCIGFDREHMPKGYEDQENVYDYLMGKSDGVVKTPKWASAITGIDEKDIEELAIEYASTKPACILPGLGFQRTLNGEQSERCVAMLTCLTGNVGKSGGSAAGANWTDEHPMPSFPLGNRPSKGKIPTFLWTKAVKEGVLMGAKDGLKETDHLDTNIKLIFNLAGNTLINQHSNINETIKILKDESLCELIVCSDVFMTPSARYADIILPATSLFEGNNIALPWTYGHYLLHNTKVTEPMFECKFEYEWISTIAKKLGVYEEFSQGHQSVEDWLIDLYNQTRKLEKELPPYDLFKKYGGYQYKKPQSFIAYKKQIEEKIPFHTPSGKIEIFSPDLYNMKNLKEIPGIPKYTPTVEGVSDPLIKKYPLQLIGYHTKRRCHSIHDNNDYMEKIDPPALWINPHDAKRRNINNDDVILVYNDRGQVKIKAFVTERIMRGVVAMSQGGWYTPDKNGIDIRGSINVLTMSKPSPLAKGNPQHTNLVEVRLYD